MHLGSSIEKIHSVQTVVLMEPKPPDYSKGSRYPPTFKNMKESLKLPYLDLAFRLNS